MVTPIDLTEKKDGGVLKEILREGEGDCTPCESSTVNVHYHGTLEDGTVFDSSKDRGEEFKFKLGTGQVGDWCSDVLGSYQFAMLVT